MVVDLAAERGGNCELTRPDEIGRPQGRDDHRAVEPGVARALPRQPDVLEEHHHVPHAPARQGGRGEAVAGDNTDDEITRETLLTHQGGVVHARVRELLA